MPNKTNIESSKNWAKLQTGSVAEKQTFLNPVRKFVQLHS